MSSRTFLPVIALLIVFWSLLVPSVYADEWDIFDEIEEEIDASEEQQRSITYESSWQLRASWQTQWEHEDSFLKSVSSEDSRYFTFVLENEGEMLFYENWRLSLRGGAWVTSKGKHEFLHDHPSIDENDVLHTTFFHTSWHELSLQYTPSEHCILEGGLLPQKNLVNSVFLDTGNYLERFFDHSWEIGAYTFPGIKVFLPFRRHALSFMYFPGLPESNNPIIADLFQLGKTDNLIALQSSHYLGDGRISLLGFVEEKRKWRWNTPYLGLGSEIQYPFSSFVFHAQALMSNGEPEYTLKNIAPDSDELYLLSDEVSREKFFGEALVMLNFPVGSALDMTLGYNYNGRGLSGQKQDLLFVDLEHTTNLNILQAASGIGSSARSYVRHLGLIHLSYPTITEHIGASTLMFLDMLDGSGKIHVFSFFNMTEHLTINAMGTMIFGNSSTLFGSEFHKTTLTFGIDIVF